ncbi:MAG TPA: hypothetical protein PKD42_15740 [Chitinophagaceae bacterium]|nr:hypothetical protein [Chitinophagaceae bacterium]
MTIDKNNIAAAIRAFASGDTGANAIQLFNTLGYNTSRSLTLSKTSAAAFKEEFNITAASGFNDKNALVSDWESVHLLFQLSASEMQQQVPMFQPTVERNEPASFLFLAVKLKGAEYSRTQLATIAREINKPFVMDVFVLFHYGNNITLSLIERRPNKRVMEKDVMEKVTHIYNINIHKPHAAHIHILYTFSFEAIEAEGKRKKLESFKDLQTGWKKVISTQILNRQFYLDYSKLSVKLIKAIHPKQVTNKLLAHQGVLNLLNRIMFIYFVQKKEWIMKDADFLHHFWEDYLKAGNDGNNAFHEKWLNSIFFSAFNGKAYKDPKALKAIPEPYKSALTAFPYLNGGLFAKNEELDNFILADKLFHDIFSFFNGYIFTITEDTPYDVNLEINPELLGKMYEGMINATDLDDVDAEHGIVYTERPEINFMVRRSLVEVLDKKLDSKYSRDFLYHFIFDEPDQKVIALKKYKADTRLLRQAVASLTACDPACGSGSMLLGVIQVQMELLRVLDELGGKPHTPKDDFVIKKQLISECIYGVDIKEWAVRIAELRLWLYMIAEAEFTADELTKEPLLPNLDFKLRCGNSLLQKFGDLDFTIEDLFKGKQKNKGAAKQLNDYIKKKKAFILNQAESNTSYQKLKEEERAVFLDYIRELITEKEQGIQKRKVSQAALFAGARQTNVFEGETEALKAEIEQLRQLRSFIVKERRLPFSYDIDFMEVFVAKEEDPGFDLVIGNPPYVRQEEILPPEDGEYLEKLMRPENKAKKAKVNKEYKELLSNKVFDTYPFLHAAQTFKVKKQKEVKAAGKKVLKEVEVDEKKLVYGNKVPGRSDLYVYFQLLCPHYLNSKGTFCFIISNSWLDVDFGSFVQHFLLKHTALLGVYDCNVRSFDAAVNTIIYLHGSIQYPALQGGRSGIHKLAEPVSNTTRFVMNKIDYTEVAYAPLLIEQENCRQNTFKDLYRTIPLAQQELYTNGYDEEENEYAGDKWGGKFLRAPEIYYKILEKGDKKLTQLKKIAEIKFGIKTGANEFFYIDKSKIKELGIEKEFVTPIIKSPKDFTAITVSEKQLDTFVFSSGYSKSELKHTNAIKYISWGEKSHIGNSGKEEKKFNERPSCNRNPWYSIEKISGNTFWGKELRERLSVFCAESNLLVDCRLYTATLSKAQQAILNSSLSVFIDETLGRQLGGGGGPRSVMVYEVQNLIVLNETSILNRKDLEKKFDKLKQRTVLPFLEELGFNRNEDIRSQTPNPLSDRKELDDIVFDALGLTPEERNEVYWAVAELVKQRLDKAASR